ncbi:hypothetical protein [Microtetraspora malaysiensis]|uniref:hypothetical protein n=1 Tax=Microtetraspora malaysiensis TaxID=161358 RepID=UPI003D8A5DBB
MRPLAYLLLRLYPRAWRDRYGDEMRDLLAARHVRLRTLADLCFAMLDAWTHRKLIRSGRGSFLQPVPLLAIGACTLWAFWNPATRDVSSLNKGWAAAVETTGFAPALASASSIAFTAGVCLAILGSVPLHARVLWRVALSKQAIPIPAPVALSMLGMLVFAYAQIADAYGMGMGFPSGPLGKGIWGGFLAPAALSLALALPHVARSVPAFERAARWARKATALAAGVTALGWLPAIALTVSGASGMSLWFLIPVAVSVLISLAMCVAVARFALSTPRPPGLPEPATA